MNNNTINKIILFLSIVFSILSSFILYKYFDNYFIDKKELKKDDAEYEDLYTTKQLLKKFFYLVLMAVIVIFITKEINKKDN